MILIRPCFEILPGSISYPLALELVATSAAQCYNKSLPAEEKKKENYIRERIKAGHESILEHASVSVKFTVDRGVTHEMVRHRLCAFTQSSTRYCDYSGEREGGHVKFVIPPWAKTLQEGIYDNTAEQSDPAHSQEECLLIASLCAAERAYHSLRERGVPPEYTRAVLPHATAAHIVVSANIREWRHIFRLRALGEAGRPHPQMQEVMMPLLAEFQGRYGVFFEDLGKK
jgi:thymidylate synthase (FAD)